MRKVKAIFLGAGARGAKTYAPYAIKFPDELEIVAVAEPQQVRRAKFAEDFKLAPDCVVENWEDILNRPKFADTVIVCTQDKMHFEPTMKALELGYHVLLEKPMSPSLEECLLMEQQAQKYDRLLTVCHVLRYTPFWRTIKEVITNKQIGDVVHIQLNENVGYYHIAHSYVRGQWSSTKHSSPMILAKSCHDMDILSWLVEENCERVSSLGSLFHFKKSNAPDGAPLRCTDGCPVADQCPYYAPRFYIDENNHEWAAHFSDKPDPTSILEQLATAPYGRCVYHCDNDVVDHQVANLEFTSGITASFTMSGFTYDMSREVIIMGTKGELRGKMEDKSFTIRDFRSQQETKVDVHVEAAGHGGGDEGLIRSFVHSVANFTGKRLLEPAGTTIQGHLMAFAAEASRLEKGKPVEINSFIN